MLPVDVLKHLVANATTYRFKPEAGVFGSGVETPIVAVIFYLSTLWVLKRWIANRKEGPFDLKWIVVLHNLFLSASSLVMFALLAAEFQAIFARKTFFEALCDDKGELNHGRHYVVYTINYWFKAIEFIDTFLLVLRGKPTPLLHVWHHSATFVLCWTQLRAEMCMQWFPMFINLAVHVVMYLYFALAALGIQPWWKKLLTVMQITQFATVLLVSFPLLTARILGDFAGISWMPLCWGNYSSSFFALFLFTTYLYLFIEMYKETYNAKGKKGKGSRNTSKAAEEEGIKQE